MSAVHGSTLTAILARWYGSLSTPRMDDAAQPAPRHNRQACSATAAPLAPLAPAITHGDLGVAASRPRARACHNRQRRGDGTDAASAIANHHERDPLRRPLARVRRAPTLPRGSEPPATARP